MSDSTPDYHLQFLNYPSAGKGAGSVVQEPAEAEIMDAYSRAVIGAVAKVGPSVAHVHVKSRSGGGQAKQPREVEGTGSGVVITPDGYCVTNSHVVEAGDSYTVTLADGSGFNAELIGQDTATDLALLRIQASGLPIAGLGDSD